MASEERIVKKHSRNLDTLKRAFKNDDVMLVECQRVKDGAVVAMLCGCHVNGKGEWEVTPFAEMVNGDPFEMYRPPNPDGGFCPTESEEKGNGNG